MGLTDRKVDTKKLHFDKDWIEVRTKRLYGDTVKAQRAAATNIGRETSKDDKKGAAAPARIEFDIAAFNLALVTSMTISWSDELPVTTENYELVPDDIVTKVLEEITDDVEDEEELGKLKKTSTSVSELPEKSSV